MNAIALKGAEKRYKTFCLGPIDLTLPMGSILGLVGENGAGKSTTIKLLLDLVHPTGGSVEVLGQPVPACYPGLKEEIGVVLDTPPIPATLTAQGVGRIMAAAHSNWEPETYEKYLTRLGLPRDQKFSELSRGTQMKLALATALSHRARLLILDEATSGLDPVVRQEILDILYDFCDEDHAVLLSSHIISDLEKICDYIAFLHRGKLLLMDEKDRLLERFCLLRCDEETLEALAPEAIAARVPHRYGTEVLAERALLPAGLTGERPTLEDLMILMCKKEEAR